MVAAGTESYLYNGDGVRVGKAVGSTGRLYWPDLNGASMNETSLTGTGGVRNVYARGVQVAREDASGNWIYPLQDHLGSTRAVLNASGAKVYDADYYPCGTLALSTGSTTNLYGFTGYETDTESGTNYATYRNQSGTLGRFLRPDPYDGSYDISDPQTLNRYVCANNNPVSNVDPTGLYVIDCMWDFCLPCPHCGGSGGDSGGGGSSGSPNYSASALSPGFSIFAPTQQLQDYAQAEAQYEAQVAVAFATPIQNNGKSGTSGCIATGLQFAFPGSTVTMGGSTVEVGGHWNFSLQLQFTSQNAATMFSSMYAAASSGWPPPARFGAGPALHLEDLGSFSVSDDGTYTIGATAHIDLFNPDTGTGGIAGHVLDDGFWGHIVQFFGGNIDPKACPFI
jgi:RHS repeat-associated protein